MRVTLRGISLLAAGAILGVVAAAVQSLALARMSALLLGLVLVGLTWVAFSRHRGSRLHLRRRIDPPRPVVDETARVQLQITNGSLGAWSRLRERVPENLGRTRARAVGAQRNRWTYDIRPGRRGYHRLGPSTLVHGDPLGLLRWRAPGDPGEPVLIWPRTVLLEQSMGLRDLSGSDHSPFGLPERSLEDLTLREYVRGDDLGRVHWRSSARRGQLMVRADEPTHPATLDMMLHLGRGMTAEWAVSTFASLAVGLVTDGVPVRLHLCRHPGPDVDGELVSSRHTRPDQALDEIASATPTPSNLRATQLQDLHSAGRALIAVLDRPDAPLVQHLAGLARQRRAFALVVSGQRGHGTSLTPMVREGWSVHVARSHTGTTGIEAAWAALLGSLVRH